MNTDDVMIAIAVLSTPLTKPSEQAHIEAGNLIAAYFQKRLKETDKPSESPK